MPQIKKIKETMLKKIPQETLNKFDFTGCSDNPADVIALIDRMDDLLTKEQCLQIMENQGCCKSGRRKEDCKAFALKYKDKSLSEKIALIPQIQYMMEPRLNSDGTITVTYGGFQNGVHTGKTTCSCGTIIKCSILLFFIIKDFCLVSCNQISCYCSKNKENYIHSAPQQHLQECVL